MQRIVDLQQVDRATQAWQRKSRLETEWVEGNLTRYRESRLEMAERHTRDSRRFSAGQQETNEID